MSKPPLSKDDEALLHQLDGRKPSELITVLLEMSRRMSARRRPIDLVTQLERDPFVKPSFVDLRTSVTLDALALEAAPDFEAVLLSPLAPLGSCSLISPTTQDRSVTTSRTTEVVSDPTNMLAIECARRLLRTKESARLCTLHQVVRPQRYPAKPGLSQHFRLFAMGEAGFATAEHGFEVAAMARQAGVFLRLFDLAEAKGYRLPERRGTLHVAERAKPLADRVLERLDGVVPVEVKPGFTSPYYDGVRLLIGAVASDGEYKEIADIGVFDWMGKLTSNKRTRFVASGLGIQLLSVLYHPATRQG